MKNSLWQNRSFMTFFSSTTIGNIGDWFDVFALQLLFAHNFHASPWMLGVLFAIYCLPGLLFSNFSGVIADHFNPQRLLLGTDLICGILTLFLAFSDNMTMALILVLLRGFFANINAPAQQTTLKSLVNDQHLLQATAYSGISFQLCQVVGPFIGAILVAFYSPRLCIGINAVSFFASCVLLLFLSAPKTQPVPATTPQKPAMLNAIAEAWKIILHTPTLRAVMLLFFLCFFAAMVSMTQSVVLLKLLYPTQPNLLGYVMAASAVGSTLGGFYLSRKKQLSGYLKPVASGLFVMTVGYALFSQFQSNWSIVWLYVISIASGVGVGLMMVVYSYALKKEPAAPLIGRVYSAGLTIQSAIIVTGSLVMGAVTHALGVRAAFLIAGGLCAIGFLLSLMILKNR